MAMSSTSGVTLTGPKGLNNATHSPSSSYAPSGVSASSESGIQRRSGGSGSFGPGPTSRLSASARNNQAQRKQHNQSKRSRWGDEDDMAESNAVKSTSSRKGQTSITHLMSFSLPPRPHYHQHNTPNHRFARRNPTWGLGSGYHAIDKARYVHANYRFIVNPKGDYHPQAVDSDVHIDWTMVLQILVSAQTQDASCPICLSTPTAPRMAKCGHIFCLPCLIRYMHSTDESNPLPEKKARSQKCPICWDSIYTSDTRPVRWYMGSEGEPPHEGGDVLLRLLSREAGSTLALPKDSCEALAPLDDVPWFHVAEVIDYARVMKGGEDYMTEESEAEIRELERQEREDELMFGDDTTWTKKAVVTVKDAIERIKGIGNPPNAPESPAKERKTRPPIKFVAPDEGAPEMYSIQHALKSGQSSSGESGSPFRTPSASEPVSANASTQFVNINNHAEGTLGQGNRRPSAGHSSRRGSHSAGPSRSPFHTRNAGSQHSQQYPFYFYQALPHYYLSPLDIRILKSAFGDFSLFPSTILPRVEHVSTGHIVDGDLRKRAKYLAHLPYGCEVSFLECDWRDLVSPEILETFKQDIERRRRRNREKETREEKERVRAEKEEDDKRWAAARIRKRPSVVDRGFSDEDFQALPLIHGSPPGDTSFASASPPYTSHAGTTSKFASLASPSTSPITARTVWGTAAVVPQSPSIEPVVNHHDDARDDGWLQGWEGDLLGDDELVAQIEASSLGEGASTPNPGPLAGTGKKKKNKKITLMSTSNARRGA